MRADRRANGGESGSEGRSSGSGEETLMTGLVKSCRYCAGRDTAASKNAAAAADGTE